MRQVSKVLLALNCLTGRGTNLKDINREKAPPPTPPHPKPPPPPGQLNRKAIKGSVRSLLGELLNKMGVIVVGGNGPEIQTPRLFCSIHLPCCFSLLLSKLLCSINTPHKARHRSRPPGRVHRSGAASSVQTIRRKIDVGEKAGSLRRFPTTAPPTRTRTSLGSRRRRREGPPQASRVAPCCI